MKVARYVLRGRERGNLLLLPDGARMTTTLVCDALRMAIWQRKPAKGLIVHTDRGSQYASHEYRRLLKTQGCANSVRGSIQSDACPVLEG